MCSLNRMRSAGDCCSADGGGGEVLFFYPFVFCVCFLTKMCSAGDCRSADGGGGEVSDALQCPRARGCGLGRQVLKSW